MGCRFSFSIRCCCQPTRGGISYERADMNADSERILVCQPQFKRRYRSRCCSEERYHPRRKSAVLRQIEPRRPGAVDVIDVIYNPMKMLERSAAWEFDVFHFDVLTGGRPLVYVGYHTFEKLGLLHTFKLDAVRLLSFIARVEDNYHDNNPYHNALHAADVTQAMFCFLGEKKLARCMGPLEQLVALMSAMAHDVDHPGVTNAFLAHTNSPLATLYRESILEHHHGKFGLALLHETGLLSHFQRDQWSKFTSLFKSIILATDISRQGIYVQRFKTDFNKFKSTLESSEETRQFILKMAMKCSDVCNPCRGWTVSKRWSEQVCQEFFQQSAVERRRGLKVTEAFDPRVQTVSKIQIGFIDVVVLPLVELWQSFLDGSPLSSTMLSHVRANRAQWTEIRGRELKAQAGEVLPAEPPRSGSSSSGKSMDTLTQASSSRRPSPPQAVTHARSGGSSSPSKSPGKDKGKGSAGKNTNRNNLACSTEEVVWLMGGDAEDDEEEEEGGEEEQEWEEEELGLRDVSFEDDGHGEEADTVENNVNLAFHYQTDHHHHRHHAASEGGGCHHPLLPPAACPEEQLRLLASLGARRHSMPVPVRQEPGYSYYYYHPGSGGSSSGSRKESSFACYSFLRRQSLPTTTVQIAWPESRTETLLHKDSVSVDAVKGFAASKISPHAHYHHHPHPGTSTVIDARLHSFSLVPLQTQKQRLQQQADRAQIPRAAFSSQASQAPPSSSCLEFRRRSQISREDAERARTALLSRVVSGVQTCQQDLVGLAHSWPSIRRRSPGEKDEGENEGDGEGVHDELRLLAEQLELPSPEESSGGSSLSSSRTNSSDSIQVRFSPPPFLRMLGSRRH